MEDLVKALREHGVICMAGDKERELLLHRPNWGFEYIDFAGVDTRKLHDQMRGIDWMHHPDHVLTAAEASGNKELSAMYAVFKSLHQLGDDYRNHNEAGQFLIRFAFDGLYQWHFTGTPVEKALIAESPYRREYFYRGYKIPEGATATQLLPMIGKRELLEKFCQDPSLYRGDIPYPGLPPDYDRLNDQLSGLGYVSRKLDRSLQMQLSEQARHFCIIHEENGLQAMFEIRQQPKGYELLGYEAKYQHICRIFPPDVTRDEVIRNINQLYHLNKITMNTQKVVEQMEKTMKNMGFGEKHNGQLKKNIEDGVSEFTLNPQHEFNRKKVDYVLSFRAGEERYFLNKIDATILNDDPAREVKQTFKINNGNGFTAKEMFNLMEGRAVEKLVFKGDEQYHAWFQLDKEKTNANGKEIRQFHENYGYDPEKVLLAKGIIEMNEQKTTDELMYSLRKGNIQQVHVERDGEKTKYFIAANPQFKTVDVHDHQMKKIHRGELLGPQQKAEQTVKKGKDQKEDQTEKKQQGRSRKMTV